ncbi:MAG: aspartate aminotransferase family protein [Acidobacteria bacterium]|uniref:Aspartate aminotransferase family protein n=1 Tax=Candidatus Polarisedimenticola svalbardensis TaxID=2886004 RepID=A0A8J6XYT4_9BACT|nr:aspartate aminotransferase family protein [Candidatus Polarisedimenticola svalbardensis]
MNRRADLHSVADQAADFLESLAHRHITGTGTPESLLRAMDRPFPESGSPASQVIRDLVADVEEGLTGSAGPRYFGFVTGGATPAGLMADWLTSTWDQNAQVYATSPAAAAAETIVARWIVELLGLPAGSSVGFVTGCQMANFTALLCARNTVLERAGWDLAKNGLFGAPPVTVLMSDCGHGTVHSALRMIGVGSDQILEIPSDSEGRLKLDALEDAIHNASGRPMILSLQAGNVNTGAFEPVGAVADLVKKENAWIHVDGAFGLWAAVSPDLARHLVGLDRADSWATDAHKWLNVPYDSGIVILKDPKRHRTLKTSRCDYAGVESADRRDGSTWSPENSRRARAFVLYALLRELGRSGVREMVERCCSLARKFAEGVSHVEQLTVLNEVVLNQVLIAINLPGHGDKVALHDEVASRIQSEGRCWLGTTTWKGRPALRVSVCNWSTTEEDIETALGALRRTV